MAEAGRRLENRGRGGQDKAPWRASGAARPTNASYR
jgi:hypothetical protein